MLLENVGGGTISACSIELSRSRLKFLILSSRNASVNLDRSTSWGWHHKHLQSIKCSLNLFTKGECIVEYWKSAISGYPEMVSPPLPKGVKTRKKIMKNL